MIIQIEQTVHGYEVGHQLLMSSTLLTSDAKQTLLVQSDLSGSNIDEHFKTYITGYPLSNYYAFSKTWYADEMPRPGCVWTQTLLIAFSDLGKIPDLQQLRQFFKRPVRGQYEDYAHSLILEQVQLENRKLAFGTTPLETSLLRAVYENPQKTIFLPAQNSLEAEEAVLQLWSGQWPRLRRNFLFCTGALSTKSLERREFDLQVIPRRTLISVEMQSPNNFIVQDNEAVVTDWINILYQAPKSQLRRFLWVFGSDVPGDRKNYKPLVQLYAESLKERPDLHFVADLVSKAFGGEREGLKLKKKLFNDRDLFNFDIKELLSYWVTADDQVLQSLAPLDLGERLVTAYKSREININEFVDFYTKSADRLPADVWSDIAINDIDLLALITKDYRLLRLFSGRLSQLATFKETWQTSNDLQFGILELLESNSQVHWDEVLYSMLAAKSDVIYAALISDKRRVKILLKLLNILDDDMDRELYQRIIQQYKGLFIDYIRESHSSLSSKTCNKIFQNLTLEEIRTIGFDAAKWLTIYKKITYEPSRIFASCVLLSFGFNRKVNSPVTLVLGCFSDVYYFAKTAKINVDVWGIVPLDMSEEEEEPDFITSLFNYLNLFSPRKNDIPTWDYCELLLRTLVNKFIKYNWPRQTLLECLTTPELTQNTIRYCLSFRKGVKLLKELFAGINSKKLQPNKDQYIYINDIGKNIRL